MGHVLINNKLERVETYILTSLAIHLIDRYVCTIQK